MSNQGYWQGGPPPSQPPPSQPQPGPPRPPGPPGPPQPPPQAPQPGRKKLSPWWYVVIAEVVVALVAVGVWWFAFNDGGRSEPVESPKSSQPRPAKTEAPSDDPTTERPEETPEPTRTPEPTEEETPDPSEEQSDVIEEVSDEPTTELPPDDDSEWQDGVLPWTVGAWELHPDPTVFSYVHSVDGRRINWEELPSTRSDYDKELAFVRDSGTTSELQEFDGGYCYSSPVQGGVVSNFLHCQVEPARSRGQFYALTAAQPDETGLSDMLEVAQAIARYGE